MQIKIDSKLLQRYIEGDTGISCEVVSYDKDLNQKHRLHLKIQGSNLTFDELSQLSSLFQTKDINIGSDLDPGDPMPEDHDGYWYGNPASSWVDLLIGKPDIPEYILCV
jgi:hypothetical protein